jgi:hypothetical protein
MTNCDHDLEIELAQPRYYSGSDDAKVKVWAACNNEDCGALFRLDAAMDQVQ